MGGLRERAGRVAVAVALRDADADGMCDAGDADADNDGSPDVLDSDDANRNVCRDSDTDTCDDCSTGTFDPANDGADFDLDGRCDAGDADDDNDGVNDPQDSNDADPRVCRDQDNDTCDDCSQTGTAQTADDGLDTDLDGRCDAGDTDDDGDSVADATDPDSLDRFVCGDSDGDGCDDCSVAGTRQPNNDGVDADGDGQCDAADTDDDDDLVSDLLDRAPNDPTRCSDIDGDTCDDCSVTRRQDVANDGVDTDVDGQCDLGDLDDDGDGVQDVSDLAPTVPTQCRDADGDTCDDCSVRRNPPDPSQDGTDTDADGQCDLGDLDDDGDTVNDGADVALLDRERCRDADADGCDDCSNPAIFFPDPFDDGADADSDGVCNVTDTDDDADGVPDASDPAPTDRFACGDSEPDGCDDCALQGVFAPGNDGTDSDGDGTCDTQDTDDDGDTVPDTTDVNPLDARACRDADLDGCDDCAIARSPVPANDGPDGDGDGWCTVTDCDDADATEFPGQVWFGDCDADGFHRNAQPVVACDPAEARGIATGPCPGVATNWAITPRGPDCDDVDASEFPGQSWFPDCDADGTEGASFPACAREDADATDPCDDGATPDGGYANTAPPVLDCADDDDTVSPTLPEACEPVGQPQVDTDCNGNVNTEGNPPVPATVNIQILYRDRDLDGFGNPLEPVDGCEVAPGLSFNSGDCDDTRPDIHVGADEICDVADQNCNNLVDEADFLAEDASLCVDLYRDRDGDGYGDVDATRCLCTDASLTAVFDNERYVATFSDCDDLHADIRPHECNDGTDNDGDDLVDAFDPDCAVQTVAGGLRRPSSESQLTAPEPFVAELVDGHDNQCDGLVPVFELDCDDDGSFPELPTGATTLFDAADAGLEACAGGPIQVACFGESLTAECDPVSGWWGVRYGSSEDGFAGRYLGGHRELSATDCAPVGDCDDQCPTRCPGRDEVCDGVDDDCSDVTYAADADGIPDPMDPAVAKGGTVTTAELDVDGDGHAACTEDFATDAPQVQASIGSCEPFAETVPLTDCDDLCYLANDLATEACNGFVDVCGAGIEARDADGDGLSTCGVATSREAELVEQAFVPVLVRPPGSTPAYVPLVPPRRRAVTCDEPLRAALEAVGATLGEDTTSADLVGELCDGDCSVVVLRLSADGSDLPTLAAAAAAAGSLPEDCATAREELSARTMWDHHRLADARLGVVELECRRVFGKPCAEVGATDPVLERGAPPDLDEALDAVGAPFWGELGRFAPTTADGALLACWGDPRIEAPSEQTGGDCADGQDDASRDEPEGPDDLVAVWRGEAGDCSRCTDGIDNNCDGAADCADPTCDVCFVGQGRGCAGMRDACADGEGGCATAPVVGPNPLTALFALALAAFRRRERAAPGGR